MILLGTRVPVSAESVVVFLAVATVFAVLFVRSEPDDIEDLEHSASNFDGAPAD